MLIGQMKIILKFDHNSNVEGKQSYTRKLSPKLGSIKSRLQSSIDIPLLHLLSRDEEP